MEKTKQRGNVPVSKKTKKKSKTKSRSRNNIGVKLIEKPEYYDYNLVAAIILLTCFGLVMLYSTSAYTSTIKYGDDMYFFKKQAAISFVCIAGALFISMFDYHILARFTGVLYGVAAGSMVLVRTPLGTVYNGARRWLRDCQDRRDRLSFLHDRSHGQEDEFTQGMYDTWGNGNISCIAGICLHR